MGNTLLDSLKEIADGGTSGGSGYFCRGTITFGYKVFAAGVGNDVSFFVFNPFLPKTAEMALAKAKAFAAEHQVTTSPAKCISLTLHRETVKGRTVAWQADLTKICARWMPAYEKVWLPALEKLGISKPGDYWMHVALVNDPSGRTSKVKGDDGTERDVPDKVWVPDAIFPNEALCAKAAAEAGDSNATPAAQQEEVPQGFTPQIWAQYKADIIKEIGTGSEAELAACSANWSIPIDFLRNLIPAK